MITSPLRYPGGKAKLYPYFAELIAKNSLFNSKYCEPYAGGAGLAIRLLTNGFVENISINDIDKSIYSFWISALQNTDKFCKLIEKTPITIPEWHKQKAIWKKCDIKKPLELGFSAYFLNRTNRSGIIEGAGPIGGFGQAGEWKIDVRMAKENQIENLKSLALYSKQIEVCNFDAMDYLKNRLPDKEAFIYLDPPYFNKGQKLYKNFYVAADHINVAKLLEKNRRKNWIVSYDDVPEIRKAYSEFSPITYQLNYSAGQKVLGNEVIFLSDKLDAPDFKGFKYAA